MSTSRRPSTPQSTKQPAAKVRPLLARPGARFACAGDGLCCTDAHALGPVSRKERRQVEAFREHATVYLPLLGARVLSSTADGRCVFLGPSARCSIHATRGREAKPNACQRFPYGLVATPDGGRVTTEHRCPCRTLGERPPLDLAEAERSLTVGATRLDADARVGPRVHLTRRRLVRWDTYRAEEAAMFMRLARGERLESALGANPLPTLRASHWSDIAHLLRASTDGTACGEALVLAGDVLLTLARVPAKRHFKLQARPWAKWFDRAQERARAPGDGEDILRDYVRDQLWRMDWCAQGASFTQARAAISTQAAIARGVAQRLRALGVRDDRAMAEAVFVAELTTATSLWEDVLHQITEEALFR